MTINGSIVFGQIPQSPQTVIEHPFENPTDRENLAVIYLVGWAGNVMFVTPHTLRESGNVMRVASVDGVNFTIDNAVLLYKQHGSRAPVFERR